MAAAAGTVRAELPIVPDRIMECIMSSTIPAEAADRNAPAGRDADAVNAMIGSHGDNI